MADIAPIHPGEVLREDFLVPLGISPRHLAAAVLVPSRRIGEVVRGRRRVDADMALRLARYFGTTEWFWLNAQTRYDLAVKRDHLGDALERIQPHRGGCEPGSSEWVMSKG